MKKIQAAMFALLLSLSGLANAVIVDNTTYTTDTSSGLDWLDLTPTTTLGKSYFDVNALLGVGQTYNGWSFATESQLSTLVFDYTGLSSINAVNTSANPNLLDGLISLFGQTFTGASSSGSKGLTGDFAFTGNLLVKSLEHSNANSPIYGSSTQGQSTRSNSVGAFLVRPTTFSLSNPVAAVPEPETYAMFLTGLGLLGFVARRKNKKN